MLNILIVLLLVDVLEVKGAALSYFAVSALTALMYSFAFKKDAEIPKKIILWTVFLSLFLSMGVILFMLTNSVLLFLFIILLGCVLSFRFGRILEKKELLFNILKELKLKIKNGTSANEK